LFLWASCWVGYTFLTAYGQVVKESNNPALQSEKHFPADIVKKSVKVEKTKFEGWENCWRITNGEVELIAVADIGPRIIRFGFVGEENQFYVSPDDLGLKGGGNFRLYGGQRFWIAPESARTSYPDNFACTVDADADGVTLTAPPEIWDLNLRAKVKTAEEVEAKKNDSNYLAAFGVQKQMTVKMNADGQVTVTHKAFNRRNSPLRMAPWGLTVLAPGGFAILPNAPDAPHDGAHLLPARSIITWSYTKLTDPRLLLTDKYILVKQDSSAKAATKIGISNGMEWAAYARNDYLFVKSVEYIDEAQYPDRGSSTEIYTDSRILEFETLGPWITLKPGASVSHTELWRLFKSVKVAPSQESIDQVVLPLVQPKSE